MKPHKSQGYIALSLLLLVVVGAATFALSSFNNAARPPSEAAKRQQALVELEKAKAALLAYAGNTHIIHGDRGPGYLPAPAPDGSTANNAVRGLLPTEIRANDGSILYRLITPYDAATGHLQYVVDPALVYTLNSTAALRTNIAAAGRLEFDGAQGVAALLIYPGADAFDDIVLSIRHEEVMNAIAPAVAHYIGQVLDAYREQRNGFPVTTVALETRDVDVNSSRGSSRSVNRRGSSDNDWWREQDASFSRGGQLLPPTIDVSDAAPSWLFNEGWLDNLAGYERSRRADSVSFIIGGCPGMTFTLEHSSESLMKSGNRCGN
ncbi:MAG TPA: hypothetical protein VNR18_13945 [Hyphomicrobiales bacterium]|nr:hypothetical protein [Hyphomicrobiales bacterium]